EVLNDAGLGVDRGDQRLVVDIGGGVARVGEFGVLCDVLVEPRTAFIEFTPRRFELAPQVLGGGVDATFAFRGRPIEVLVDDGLHKPCGEFARAGDRADLQQVDAG